MATAASTSLFSKYHSSSLWNRGDNFHHRSPSSYLSCPVIRHGSLDLSVVERKDRPFRRPLRVSSEGIPDQLNEDPKFVPLNADDPIYGPPALLLLGFQKDETEKIKELLKDLDGDFLKVIHCTEDMLALSVWDAMHIQQPNLQVVKIAESLPRICISSGLSGEETIMFIDAFPESGLEPAVFAALVPNSANKQLLEVVEEVMGDHELMTARQTD